MAKERLTDLVAQTQEHFLHMPAVEVMHPVGLDDDWILNVPSLIGAAAFDFIMKQTGQPPSYAQMAKIEATLRRQPTNVKIKLQRTDLANRLNSSVH